jgi:hypothetical protein
LHTLQISLSADAAGNIMPQFEPRERCATDFRLGLCGGGPQLLLFRTAILSGLSSTLQKPHFRGLVAKLERLQWQVPDAEQRVSDVDLWQRSVFAQLEEKVNECGHVALSNFADYKLFCRRSLKVCSCNFNR